MAEIILDDMNFEEEVLMSSLPVLVDFWAPWCGPCKMLGPVISAIAEKYDGKLKVCKYNCDDSTEFAEKYNIDSIPAVKFFKDGEEVNESLGFVQQPALEAIIESIRRRQRRKAQRHSSGVRRQIRRMLLILRAQPQALRLFIARKA